MTCTHPSRQRTPTSAYTGTAYGSPNYIGSRIGYAEGGIAQAMPPGGPVEQMSRDNALGQNQMFPQSQLQTNTFSSATNTPMGSNMIAAAGDTNVDPYTGAEKFAGGGSVDQTVYNPFTHLYSANAPQDTNGNTALAQAVYDPTTHRYTSVAPQVTPADASAIQQAYDGSSGGGGAAQGGIMQSYAAGGGIGHLGGYAAGGNPRLLKGPGDGMSDNIPATIGGKQPARLADGEFVVPADVVSHLGNGSTDAGAKQLYAMMDKVRKARTGKKKQARSQKTLYMGNVVIIAPFRYRFSFF